MNKILDCLTVDPITQMYIDEHEQTTKALQEYLDQKYIGKTFIHLFGRYKGRECEVVSTAYCDWKKMPLFVVKTKRADRFGFMECNDDYHRRCHHITSFKEVVK